MDYSKLTDADLLAYKNKQYDKISSEGLLALDQARKVGAPADKKMGQEWAEKIMKIPGVKPLVGMHSALSSGLTSGATGGNFDPTRITPEVAASAQEYGTLNQVGKVAGSALSAYLGGRALQALPGISATAKILGLRGALARSATNAGSAGVLGYARNPEAGETRAGNAMQDGAIAATMGVGVEGLAGLAATARKPIGDLAARLSGLTPAEVAAFRNNPKLAQWLHDKNVTEPHLVAEFVRKELRGDKIVGGYRGGAIKGVQNNVVKPSRAVKNQILEDKTVTIDPRIAMGSSSESSVSRYLPKPPSPKTTVMEKDPLTGTPYERMLRASEIEAPELDLSPIQIPAVQADRIRAGVSRRLYKDPRGPTPIQMDPKATAQAERNKELESHLRTQLEKAGGQPLIDQNKTISNAMNEIEHAQKASNLRNYVAPDNGSNVAVNRSYLDRNGGGRLTELMHAKQAAEKLSPPVGDTQGLRKTLKKDALRSLLTPKKPNRTNYNANRMTLLDIINGDDSE